jgi:hypothetical protein
MALTAAKLPTGRSGLIVSAGRWWWWRTETLYVLATGAAMALAAAELAAI